MVPIIVFALGLVGTGLYSKNAYSYNSPVLIETTNRPLSFTNPSDPSRVPASADSDSSPSSSTSGVHITPRIGSESTLYNQTDLPSFMQTSVRASIDLNWILPESFWELDLRFNFTAVPLASNTAGLTARFFEGSADLGYSLVRTSFFRFKIMGGIYHASANITDSSFRFPTLYTPQLYPALSLYLLNKVTLNAAYHYIYLGTLFDASQVRIVRSLELSVQLNHNHSISALIEESGFNFLLPSTAIAQYYSIGFTLGYSF